MNQTEIRIPSYLRVVITTRCPLACAYCHMEGDPAQPGRAGGLATTEWVALLGAALDNGVRKLKFLGGEPLSRRDLPEIIAALRREDAALDLSLITSGVAPRERVEACFAAGLSRANLSIHGFLPVAFARRGGGERAYALRQETLALLCALGRPLKLNYVYSGPEDAEDLAALLCFARGRPLVVNVLDDLSRPELSADTLLAVLQRLLGPPSSQHREPDPHSLPTLHLRYGGDLEIEIKDQRLGEQAPYRACATCPARPQCREGIYALRLTHTGVLRPCMDRPDLGAPLLPALAQGGRAGASRAYRAHVERLLFSRVPGQGRRLPVLTAVEGCL